MYLSKKSKLYIISLLMALTAIAIWRYVITSEYGNFPPVTAAQIFEKKFTSYLAVADSCDHEQLRLNYKKTLAVMDLEDDGCNIIGERVKVSHDSLIIETFLQKIRKPYGVTVIRNINGVVSVKKINGRTSYWAMASYCDGHRFFLPRADFPTAQFDGYSYYNADTQFRWFMQVLLSDKHKPISGVVCPCDDLEIHEEVNRIDEAFRLFE